MGKDTKQTVMEARRWHDTRRIVRCIDFRYITDVLTPEEATEMLQRNKDKKEEREEEMKRDGYPAYTTSAGWLGKKKKRRGEGLP